MKFITKLFKGLGRFTVNLRDFFSSDKTASGLQTILGLVLKSAPVVMYAAKLGARTLTPLDPSDDMILETIAQRFPALFYGQPKTQDEQKLRLMLIAEEALKVKYPDLDTTELRILVNATYKNVKDVAATVN